VWLVNTSVGRYVISFTVFGAIFYIAVVVAGTSSYECPFQTPASVGLRHLKDSETTWKLLASLSPLKAISLIHAIWRDTRQGAVSASRRVYEIAGHPLSWEISPSRIRSGIYDTAANVGHQTIILLLRIDRVVGNGKQRQAQWFRRAVLLPTTIQDTHRQPLVPRNGPGLLIRVRNLETLRKQNADNVRCVFWVLRNITDPNHDPPFDLLVSAFEECFDATKQLFPGMRDRAYFSARAILQINMRARAQSHELASKYPIPPISSNSIRP
jgi:hypothetical protein